MAGDAWRRESWRLFLFVLLMLLLSKSRGKGSRSKRKTKAEDFKLSHSRTFLSLRTAIFDCLPPSGEKRISAGLFRNQQHDVHDIIP